MVPHNSLILWQENKEQTRKLTDIQNRNFKKKSAKYKNQKQLAERKTVMEIEFCQVRKKKQPVFSVTQLFIDRNMTTLKNSLIF